MTFSLGETARDQFLCALEIDDADIVPSMHEHAAIGALQRRAGDRGVFAGLADPVDLVGARPQPGPAVFIGEGVGGAPPGDVARWMNPVAVLVAPAEPLGQFFPD